MITPPKGDYTRVPLTPEGRKLADAWNPAADEAAGQQCKAYGAAAIMRVPARFRIAWQDEQTLRIESDAGMQTRMLRFTPSSPPRDRTWQGHSIANWDAPATKARRDDDEPARRLPATQWRALQRRRQSQRVLRARARRAKRSSAGRHDGRGGPSIPSAAVRGQLAFQARQRSFQMEPCAMRRDLVAACGLLCGVLLCASLGLSGDDVRAAQ